MTGRKLYILRAAGLLLAWALLLLLVFLARVWQGERKLREPGAYLSGLAEPLPDPQWVSWNGKPYEYREGLINILFLGIDGRGKAEGKHCDRIRSEGGLHHSGDAGYQRTYSGFSEYFQRQCDALAAGSTALERKSDCMTTS